MSQQNRGGDPREFVRSMFDLAYGAEDEKLTREEVRAQLKEAGINPDAAWAKTSKLIEAARGKVRLEDARAARIAAMKAATTVAPQAESKDSLVKQIQELFAAVGPGMGAMYARNWTDGTVDDLASLRDQLKRTIEREAKRRDGKR